MRRCALETVSVCEGGLSGEHYISRALLDVIAPEGKISIEGLPWAREPKSLGPNALTAAILCRRHNSLLSPLDAEAGKFAAFLRDAQLDLASTQPTSTFASFDGRILERWFLKVAFCMWASGNVSVSGEKLDTAPGEELARVLVGGVHMPNRWGLYVKPPSRAWATQHGEFEVVFRHADTRVKACDFRICRLPFSLILGKPGGDWGVRRPKAISLAKGALHHRAALRWGAWRAGPEISYHRIGDAPAS